MPSAAEEAATGAVTRRAAAEAADTIAERQFGKQVFRGASVGERAAADEAAAALWESEKAETPEKWALDKALAGRLGNADDVAGGLGGGYTNGGDAGLLGAETPTGNGPIPDNATAGTKGAGDRADILAQNRVQGRAFEQKRFSEFNQNIMHAQEQITVKTPSSVRTRLDAIGFDADGKIVIHEFKSSALAPLTNNQKNAFPEMLERGATVVGRGKGAFTRGYTIPVGTDVQIIRPE